MAVSVFRLIGSPGYPFDEEYLQQRLAGRSYDRAYDPNGYLRQLAACLVQPDRTPRLHQLRVLRWLSMVCTIYWCRPAAASPWRAPFPAPGSSGTRAWATTCRANCCPSSRARS